MAGRIKELSPITAQIIELLYATEVGAVCGYSEISGSVGMDVQKTARCYLNSAIRILRAQHRIHFQNVPNVGYMRSKNSEIVPAVKVKRFGRIVTQANFGMKDLKCVNYNELPDRDQVKHDLYSSRLGIMRVDAAKLKRKESEQSRKARREFTSQEIRDYQTFPAKSAA